MVPISKTTEGLTVAMPIRPRVAKETPDESPVVYCDYDELLSVEDLEAPQLSKVKAHHLLELCLESRQAKESFHVHGFFFAKEQPKITKHIMKKSLN